MSRRVVPVSTLVNYLKKVMDDNPVLRGVMIEGEISNIRKPYSGHWYFSIKDDHAALKCVMFSSANRKLSYPVENGDKVVLKGDVSVYVSDGSMQMIVSDLQRSGIGELYRKFDELKRKLDAEGLFSDVHKKPLPKYPFNIALVTGNNTAAREDALITLKKRWPVAVLTEYNAPVQGMDASVKIVDALQRADSGNHQIVLLVRGGGSIEDLWCFNDESLARYIFQMNTPVVTGIGHEIDFTLADFVADLRANTPTGAVEASVPDIHEVYTTFLNFRNRLNISVKNTFDHALKRYQYHANHPVFKKPERLYADYVTRLDYLAEKLGYFQEEPGRKRHQMNQIFHRFSQLIHQHSAKLYEVIQTDKQKLLFSMKQKIQLQQMHIKESAEMISRAVENTHVTKRSALEKNMSLLHAYSPLLILNRGYSVAYKNGHVVHDVKEVDAGDELFVRFAQGSLTAIVQDKEITDGSQGK